MFDLTKFKGLYTPDEIDKILMSPGYAYKTPEQQEQILFVYLTMKHRNLSLYFVLEGVNHFYSQYEQKEFEYQKYLRISSAISNHDLTDEFFTEYAGHISWSTLSGRRDLTIEIFNKYKDKIEHDRLQVNFGDEFILENFDTIKEAIYNFEGVGKDVALRYLSEKSNNANRIFKFMRLNGYNVNFFFEALALIETKKISNNWSDFMENVSTLVRTEKLSFDQMMVILDKLEPIVPSYDYSNDPESQFNGLICEMMRTNITLKQKKEIKFRGILL